MLERSTVVTNDNTPFLLRDWLEGKIYRLRHREANACKDYLHQLSTEIAKSHGIVKMESSRCGI
jgi:hypothetical protein